MAVWGLIVAVLLVIGSLPFFVGLAVVLPVLGHATWHLYRNVVEPDPNPPTRRAPPADRSPLCGRFPGLTLPVESRALAVAAGKTGIALTPHQLEPEGFLLRLNRQ
jgi:hypothetical protein